MAKYQRGMFLTGGWHRSDVIGKRTSLPDDLKEFTSATAGLRFSRPGDDVWRDSMTMFSKSAVVTALRELTGTEKLRQQLKSRTCHRSLASVAADVNEAATTENRRKLTRAMAHKMSSADVDAERLSFRAGSLFWSGEIPLLVRHTDKVAGKVISLTYQKDGQLLLSAQADDEVARRMAGLSIAATVIEAEVRNEDSPVGFHFVVTKATLDHVGITDCPSNAKAVITSRRDINAMDARSSSSCDAAIQAAQRLRKLLDVTFASPAPARPEIKAAPPLIYGRLPAAILQKKRTEFRDLVAHLPTGVDA